MADNSWSEYQKLVLDKLDRQDRRLGCLEGKVGDVAVEIAMLKVKAGVWGAIGGILAVMGPLAVALIIFLVKS